MYNDTMNEYKDNFFHFVNYSFSKLPTNLMAKFCYDDELFQIPNTEAYLSVDKYNWVLYDENQNNLFSMTNDQFIDIYLAADKKSQRYLEFIADSYLNDYSPDKFDYNFVLYEEIFGDLIEKEAPIKKRWKLILDLFMKKRIYISKYF